MQNPSHLACCAGMARRPGDLAVSRDAPAGNGPYNSDHIRGKDRELYGLPHERILGQDNPQTQQQRRDRAKAAATMRKRKNEWGPSYSKGVNLCHPPDSLGGPEGLRNMTITETPLVFPPFIFSLLSRTWADEISVSAEGEGYYQEPRILIKFMPITGSHKA